MNKTQIITRITPGAELISWQQSLSNAITDPEKLLKSLDLSPDLLSGANKASQLFRLRVTESYLKRIEKSNPSDPLLLQVLPQLIETSPQPPHFTSDPVADQAAMRTPGLLHKYHGRVLLITTEACAINCRYCFRRAFPYQQAQAGRAAWKASLEYIAADTSIEEVILSGGDPLALSDDKLLDLANRLARIPHLRRLRIHSRLPIVLPQRMTSALLEGLKRSRLQIILVIHSNHPNEIDAEVGHSLNRIHDAGITLLNQSVLLKNINNNVETLAILSKTLFAHRTLPYYLHTLDPVAGAAHFAVSDQEILELHNRLSSLLPGYLMPKFVREMPGMPAKTPI